MKKLLAIEYNGGLFADTTGNLLSGLQPQVIYWLSKIKRETEYGFVLLVQETPDADLMALLSNEGIQFENVLKQIDEITSLDTEVWGVGKTEAPNFIALNPTGKFRNWEDVCVFLKGGSRVAEHRRQTNETVISVVIDLDGTGEAKIDTGLNFFNHMLEQIARHGNIDLQITAKGDLQVDEHHTIEDTAITLGEALVLALGEKRGLNRYGFCLPMDDVLAQVAIDFGGRNWIVWDATFNREKIGDMPTEMFFHFFKSFTDAAKCNLNVKADGTNEHHKIEAIFKAFAKAIKMATRRDLNNMQLPTTKGVL